MKLLANLILRDHVTVSGVSPVSPNKEDVAEAVEDAWSSTPAESVLYIGKYCYTQCVNSRIFLLPLLPRFYVKSGKLGESKPSILTDLKALNFDFWKNLSVQTLPKFSTFKNGRSLK